ncbi:MAG: helix-turn-helix domain-containing protein [Ruminococcus sp.]|nr:helix-turn-helix domain-containing protein [Ruminococcus sp.]
MSKEFGRIISNLRKKKGLSQKDAAKKLGISQSLLSHYEKGIRECSLEFLSRTADFYEVSTDYLLGRASAFDSAESLTESSDNSEAAIVKSNTYCLLNRRLINNSASITYSILSEINNKKLQKYISDYLSIAHYNIFRSLYSLKENNPDDIFKISDSSYENMSNAAMEIHESRIKAAASNIDGPKLSFDILDDKYPESFPSLHEMIKNAEKAIIQNIKI